MKYVIDHDYHIHTFRSLCSRDAEQTPVRILRYAEENGYKNVCITDHMWDRRVKACFEPREEHFFEVQSSGLPYPQGENTNVHFGCETDIDINCVFGVSPEVFDKLELVLISNTHLHLTGCTVEEGITLPQRALIYTEKLDRVFDLPLDFTKTGIPHPVSGHASPGIPFNELFAEMGEERIRYVFTKITDKGAGVEINAKDFDFSRKSKEHIEAIIAFYKILRECGCRFYLGSDAHHPDALDSARRNFENAVEILGLTEDEKFHVFD